MRYSTRNTCWENMRTAARGFSELACTMGVAVAFASITSRGAGVGAPAA